MMIYAQKGVNGGAYHWREQDGLLHGFWEDLLESACGRLGGATASPALQAVPEP